MKIWSKRGLSLLAAAGLVVPMMSASGPVAASATTVHAASSRR